MRRKKSQLFRDPEGVLYQTGAVGYALLAYGLGIAGLFDERWFVNAGATLLLAHGMTIAAYMVHECAHNSVFRTKGHNALLGRFLMWICGASYGTFEDSRYKHLRHHSDNDDVVWFNYDCFFRETFSNPLAFPHSPLDWLTLNFGFHNAHHAQPMVSWWKLPALHRQLYGDDPVNVIPLWPQLVIFHRHRVRRIMGAGPDDGSVETEAWGRGFLEAAREGRVTGGYSASFLTSF